MNIDSLAKDLANKLVKSLPNITARDMVTLRYHFLPMIKQYISVIIITERYEAYILLNKEKNKYANKHIDDFFIDGKENYILSAELRKLIDIEKLLKNHYIDSVKNFVGDDNADI